MAGDGGWNVSESEGEDIYWLCLPNEAAGMETGRKKPETRDERVRQLRMGGESRDKQARATRRPLVLKRLSVQERTFATRFQHHHLYWTV